MSPCTSTIPHSGTERDALILSEIPHAKYIARHIWHKFRKYSLEDMQQEAMLGVIHAVDHFDPKLGISLKTFSEKRIRGAVWDYIRRYTRYQRRTNEGHTFVNNEILTTLVIPPQFDKQAEINEVVTKTGLSKAQRVIIQMKLEGHKIDSIMSRLGYSESTIEVYFALAIKKMRNYAG